MRRDRGNFMKIEFATERPCDWRDGAPLQNDLFSRKWPHARHYFGYKMLAQIRFVEQFVVEISREIHQKSMTAVELWLDLSSIQLGSTKIQTSSAAGLKMAPPCQPSMQSRLSVLSLSPYATRCHRHLLAVELLQADSERAEQQLLAWLQLRNFGAFALSMHSGLWKPESHAPNTCRCVCFQKQDLIQCFLNRFEQRSVNSCKQICWACNWPLRVRLEMSRKEPMSAFTLHWWLGCRCSHNRLKPLMIAPMMPTIFHPFREDTAASCIGSWGPNGSAVGIGWSAMAGIVALEGSFVGLGMRRH